MSKHTPGPWTYAGRKSGEDYYLVEDKLWNIARVEGEANARLIAAAPELLDALKTALLCIESGHNHEKQNSKIRAAIAKAEGKE